MTGITMPPQAAAFIVSEANGTRSREAVTLASTGAAYTLRAGHVLAKVTASGKYVEYDNAGSDGTEIAAAILLDEVVVPAAGDAKGVVILRHAEVSKAKLAWFAAAADVDKNAAYTDLAALGVIAR